jgi:hypothetical protein
MGMNIDTDMDMVHRHMKIGTLSTDLMKLLQFHSRAICQKNFFESAA